MVRTTQSSLFEFKWDEVRSQKSTVPSRLAVVSVLSSELNITHFTGPVCPLTVFLSDPVVVSQSRCVQACICMSP